MSCLSLIDMSQEPLCMRPANERRRYIVTSSLIDWAHTQTDPTVIVSDIFVIVSFMGSQAHPTLSCTWTYHFHARHCYKETRLYIHDQTWDVSPYVFHSYALNAAKWYDALHYFSCL